jgi:SAM-dependent methyltransferase
MSNLTITGAESQWVHKLPNAPVVNRLDFLRHIVSSKHVIHVGFADTGWRESQERTGTWLHTQLTESAKSVVGIDLDEPSVSLARQQGYEAYTANCCDPDALARLPVQPADIVVAGEVIEHLDAPGPFLEGMRKLIVPEGRLVITTPNAFRLLNLIAALVRIELVHPDHVAQYSWYTLSNLLGRHGWRVIDFLCYMQPSISPRQGRSLQRRAQVLATRGFLATQGLLARTGAPFVGDGLIAVCVPVDRIRR